MSTKSTRVALLLLFVAAPAMAGGNYATCLLDKLPGVANDVAANAIVQTCTAKFPGGFQTVGLGSGRGDWFGFKSGAECTAKKAADTRSERAALMIGAACRRLYEDPASPGAKPVTVDEFLKDAPPKQARPDKWWENGSTLIKP